jgi:hypothetical protein
MRGRGQRGGCGASGNGGRVRVLGNAMLAEDTYFEPNKTFPELRDLLKTHPIDPLRAFSEECRAELQGLKDR